MASTNTKPSYIPTPFANGGQKNTIPVNDQGNYLASWTMGFPAVTSTPLAQGGLPPDRLDVNGALNVLSGFIYYLQLGGYFTYDANLSTAIGGYPKNMVLGYVDSTHGFILLRSTKNNNQDNFVTNPSFIGTSWVRDNLTMSDLTTRVPANVGSAVKPVYTNENGVVTASTSNVGNSSQPVYMSNGTITALTGTIANNISGNAATATKLGTSTIGSGVKPIYLNGGTATASNSTVGSGIKPVYLSSGTITASGSTVGSEIKPVYLSSGTITESGSTVGSGKKPVYLSSGTITASNSTVGSGVKPVYLSSGTITASGSTVGSEIKPVYLSSGTITESGSTVGNNRQPVYMSNGTITACDSLSTVLGAVYPVGSIYIGTQASCPLASLISGSTWVKIEGRYLLASGTLAGTSETYSATNTVASGSPNITGDTGAWGVHGEGDKGTGAFYAKSTGWGIGDTDPNSSFYAFDASRSNNIYGSSDAVRSPAYVVNVWRRKN